MAIYDLPVTKQEYTDQFYATLLAILNSVNGGSSGDIGAPRLVLISLTKVKIDELMAQAEGVQFSLETTDNSNVIDLYINALLDECAKHTLQTAPKHIIIPTDGGTLTLNANPSPNADTGYMFLPDDYLRFVSFKVDGWLQEVTEPVLTATDIYKRQRYTALRGGLAKPVVALNSKIKINTPVAQVDTVTLIGTSGTANLSAGGLTKTVTFNTSLTQTATDFVTTHAAAYLLIGIVVTSSGEDIIFTAQTAGVAFDHPFILTLTGDITGNVVNTTPNVPTREGKRTVEYYSDPEEAHVLDKFLYIANVGAEHVQFNLHDALTWMCASKVLQIWGQFSGNASYAERAQQQIDLSYQNLI